MRSYISQWPDKLMPIDFEALPFSKFLWCGIGGYCLIENFKYIVYILITMRYIEGTMINARESDQESHNRMTMGIEARFGPQVECIILESFLDCHGKRTPRIPRNCNQVLLQHVDSFGQRLNRRIATTLRIRDNAITISHKHEGLVRIYSVQSSHLSVTSHIEQYYDKIVIYDKWSLS